ERFSFKGSGLPMPSKGWRRQSFIRALTRLRVLRSWPCQYSWSLQAARVQVSVSSLHSIGIDQALLFHLPLAVLPDRAGEMRRIGRRLQQMDGFHQAIEGVQRHHHRIGGIPARNDRVVGIVDDL